MPEFTWNSDEEKNIRVVGQSVQDGVVKQLVIWTTAGSIRRAATIYRPEAEGTYPAILFVHWYEPQAPNSNRTQFEPDALEMAKSGAVCLLIETLWSDIDWFYKRTHADDLNNNVQQVLELRQAMDILLSQPGVDPENFAYVGHDFGAMFGVVLGSIDPRPTHYVLMAGTTRFHEWYFYYPEIADDAREQYMEEMAMYNPVKRVASLAPAPLLFQFGEDDFHVPIERAEEFYAAAKEPKEIRWYEAGHGLNAQATADRIAWLKAQLVSKK